MKTHAAVFAYPEGLVSPALILWLLDNGFTRDRITFFQDKRLDTVGQYNAGIQTMMTATDADRFLFADNDVFPEASTAPILTETDGIAYATPRGMFGLLHGHGGFHATLWTAKREALETIGSPWFSDSRTPNGITKICPCVTLAVKCAEANIDITQRGTIITTDNKSPAQQIPERITYGSFIPQIS